jgi:hypothetical protein
MTTRAEELARLFQPLQRVTNVGRANLGTNAMSGESLGISGWVTNIGIILIVLFIILLIVHYTITPVFSFGLTSEGVFGVTKASDGELVWTDSPQPSTTAANFEKLNTMPFTLQMDIFVEDTLSTLGPHNRVFLYRGSQPIQSPTSILDSYPDTNIVAYLKPDTNDLCVTAITQRNNDLFLESAPTILNVPTRQPFRITITLQEKLMEVYMNGKLQVSKTFQFIPRYSTSPFYGTPDMYRNTVRIMNLQFWNYPLTAMQVLNAGPALATTEQFQPAPLPAQGTCP